MDDGIRESVSAYADYLDENGCEFFIVVREPETGNATALMSEQAVGMMAGVFDRSHVVYDAIKMAESWMLLGENTGGNLCMN